MSDITKTMRVHMKSSGIDKTTEKIDAMNKAGGRAKATQDKLEKGASSMGKNSTANFAKMSQGLGGLVHVYATVAANVFALSSAFMVLKEAVDVDIMIRAADQLSASTGISYANVAKNMKGVTQGALSMQEALRSASIGVSSGLSGKQMQDIAEIATKAANALGRSVPEAINRMTQAVVKNEPELVDEYGIILRVDSALKEYAATLGKTKSELTSFDKQMAIHAQLVKQGTTKFGDVEGQVNAYNQLGASFSELTHNVVSFINTALEPLASMFAENAGLLAALAAVFAQSVFKKAVPEVQNMTAKLADQRKEYQDLIKVKKADLDTLSNIQGMQGTEVQVMRLDNDAFNKQAKDIFESLPMDTLEDELSDSLKKGLKDGSNKGFQYFDDISTKTMKSIRGNVENLASGSEAVRKSARENLKTFGLTEQKAIKLEALYRRHTGELNKQNVDSKENLNWLERQTIELQKQLNIRQKNRLVAKDLRAGAFGAGASGGFLGGGFAEANKSIKANKSISMMTAGSVRIAGIFGNISGMLGSIMSLMSGWGIALFVVSQAIVPIADGLGLSSKAARKAKDDFDELGTSFDKLQETASKIGTKNVEDLQDAIDKSKASANNLNEQLTNVTQQMDLLGDISKRSFLDKVFAWDWQTTTDAINTVERTIKSIYTSKGLTLPEKLSESLVHAKNLDSAIGSLYQRQNDIKEELKETSKESDKYLTLTRQLSDVKSQILVNEQSMVSVQNELTKGAKEQLQLERDKQDLLTKSKDGIEEISKLQTEATSAIIKGSTYGKEYIKLQDISKALKSQLVSEKEKKVVREQYAEALNLEYSTQREVSSHLWKRTRTLKKAIEEEYTQKEKQKQITMQIGLAQLKFNRGDISANNELLALKKQQRDYQLDLLDIEIATANATREIIRNQKGGSTLSVEYVLAKKKWELLKSTRAILTKTNEEEDKYHNTNLIKTQRANEIHKEKVNRLNTELSIIKELSKASPGSNIKDEFNKKREISLAKVKELNLQINTIEEDSRLNSGKAIVNAEKLKTLKAQITLEQTKFNTELSKTVEIAKVVSNSLNLGGLQVDKDISEIESKLTSLGKLTSLELFDKAKLLESQKHIKTMHKFEIQSAKIRNKAITEAYSTQQQALDLANVELSITQENVQYAEELRDLEAQRFKARKDASNIFEDPEGFTELLGKEFEKISKDFSKSIMNPVELAADSMLRIMDTATDTLYDAIKSGENVGKAVGNAILAVADDITREITTDIMKGWSRDILKSAFGIESAAEKRAQADKLEQEEHTRLLTEIAKCRQDGSQNGPVGTDIDAINKSFQDDLFNLKDASGEQSTQLADQIEGFSEREIKEWQANADNTITAVGTGTKATQQGTTTLTGEIRQAAANIMTGFSNLGSSQESSGGIFDSILGIGSSLIGGMGSMISGGLGAVSSLGTAMGGLGTTPFSEQSMMLAAQAFKEGGITNSLNRYATGGITDGPELAMIGDNSSGKEAVVPLPSGEKIPVEFSGDSTGGDTVINNTINITGVDSNNKEAIRRSAGQVAQAAGNATNRAVRRNG